MSCHVIVLIQYHTNKKIHVNFTNVTFMEWNGVFSELHFADIQQTIKVINPPEEIAQIAGFSRH